MGGLAMSTPERATAAAVTLAELRRYLAETGWREAAVTERAVVWTPPEGRSLDVEVVLPAQDDVRDSAERVNEALLAIAYAQRRTPAEVLAEVEVGGADIVAVRLRPEAPEGQAPLGLAHTAIGAVRQWIAGSAAALEIDSLVLPARRPQQAESFANEVLLATSPGSFILQVTLPLNFQQTQVPEDSEQPQRPLLVLPPQPYGRRVAARMQAVAQRSASLARAVGAGDEPLRVFGQPEPGAANATELEALAALGGAAFDKYQLRFTRAMRTGEEDSTPFVMSVTPAEQRILKDAAEFLRTKQPRTGVTITGLVVRLFRASAFGPGQVVVQGVDDDSGIERRYRLELAESDYAQAVAAHGSGHQVIAIGDLEIRGTRLSLVRVTSFSVLPGLDDD
jgi:hypothetical protein